MASDPVKRQACGAICNLVILANRHAMGGQQGTAQAGRNCGELRTIRGTIGASHHHLVTRGEA